MCCDVNSQKRFPCKKQAEAISATMTAPQKILRRNLQMEENAKHIKEAAGKTLKVLRHFKASNYQ